MDEKTKAYITATFRTALAGADMAIPGIGLLAAAWSEYDGIKQSERTNAFFKEVTDQLRRLQSSQANLSQKVAALPGKAELFERCIEAAKAEPNDAKRPSFSKLYVSFLTAPSTTSLDERLDMISHLEQLNESDLAVLEKFAHHNGVMRGDMVTATVRPSMNMINSQPQTHWLEKYGDKVHSLAKLEARGLLIRTQYNAHFGYEGEPNSDFNLFRERAWRMTPIAMKLLTALKQ